MKNLKNTLWKGALLFTMALTLFSCKKDDDENVTPAGPITPNQPKDNIAEIATKAGFDSLVVALSEAGLVSTFQGDDSGPYTVFAPTNEAFRELLTALSANRIADIDTDLLTTVLTYHVVEGKVKSTSLSDGLLVKTLSGYTFTVNTSPDITIDVNNSDKSGIIVADTDIMATNGVIHVIESVLVPDEPATTPTDNIATIAIDAGFDSLVVALDQVGLVPTFQGAGSFTVFAPTNEAFEDLLSNLFATRISDIDNTLLLAVLQTHVVDGILQAGQLTDGKTATTLDDEPITFDLSTGIQVESGNTQDANIGQNNIWATNGIIHVIDKVLLP